MSTVVTALSQRLGRLGRAWIVPLVLLAAWQWMSSRGGAHAYVFVPLQTLWATLASLIASGELPQHLLASLTVVLKGLAIGGLTGVAIGALMAGSRSAEALISPLFNAWRPVPTLGFIPLIALWFGNGDVAKLVLVSLAAAEPMILNTFQGLRSTEKRLIESAEVLTFSRWQLFVHVQLPSALPSMLTGVQHALGFAWIAGIGAELLFTIGPGLGGIMERAQMAARMDIVIVCVFCIGLVGLLINTLFRRIGSWLLRWRDVR